MYRAFEELREMTHTQVNVNGRENDRSVSVQDEAGQRQYELGWQSALHSHLNTSTLAYGSDDSGRNRLMVNFVG